MITKTIITSPYPLKRIISYICISSMKGDKIRGWDQLGLTL